MKKKWLIVWGLAILIPGVFGFGIVSSKESKSSGGGAGGIKCPKEIPLPPKEFCEGKPSAKGKLCTGGALKADRGKFLEQYGGAEMTCEVKRFQKDTLDKAHHDNVSNPEFIAKEGIKKLRMHHQCLQDICRNVYQECLKYPGAENQDIEQQLEWCRRRADRLFDLQKEKLFFIATTNQERKERSLLDEKFSSLRERFKEHIHERTDELLTHVHRFEQRIDRLIYNP